MKITKRKDAIRLGLKRYFTGKPCPKGHIAERYTVGHCVICTKDRANERYANKKDHIKKLQLIRYAKKKDQINATARSRYKPKVITRSHLHPIVLKHEALALGLKKYFTGVPCKRGHISERYATGACIECMSIAQKALYQKNKTHRKKVAKVYYDTNKDKISTISKEKRAASKTKKTKKIKTHIPVERITKKTKARELGQPFYYTGLPCVNGHITDRETKSGHCLACKYSIPNKDGISYAVTHNRELLSRCDDQYVELKKTIIYKQDMEKKAINQKKYYDRVYPPESRRKYTKPKR